MNSMLSGSTGTPLVSRAASTATKSLLAQVCSIVASCSARAVLDYAAALEEAGVSLLDGSGCEVIIATKTPEQKRQQEEQGSHFIHVPLSRLGQVKIAVFRALTRGLVSRGDLVVCLSGLATGSSKAAVCF